jgi:outer membrane protein assembly factor BamB
MWAQVLLGISAAGGGVQWRFTARLPGAMKLYAPGLMSVTTSSYSGGTSLDELDPATGRIRWQVVSAYPAIAIPAGIVTAPGPGQVSLRDPVTGKIRWTARLTGAWPTLAADPGQTSRTLPAFPAGPFLVVPTTSPGDADLLTAFRRSDGQRTWQITLPGALASPLSVGPGGMLVQTAATPPHITEP